MFVYFAMNFAKRFIDKKSWVIKAGNSVKEHDKKKLDIFKEIIAEFNKYALQTLEKRQDTYPELY